MSIVKPFAALRPDRALAARLCELPYDVLSSAEARRAAACNPLSFFHVSKPEIDFAPEIEPHDERVYARGRENFLKLIAQGALKRDLQAAFYLYRQVMGAHTQLGLVALGSCEEYLHDTIRKHELTRPDKEDDRVRHIESLNAQTGPAFLIYPAEPTLDEFLRRQTEGPTEVDYVAADGVRHSAWAIQDRASQDEIESRFSGMPLLYIADGHHRTAAAARIYQKRQGAGRSGYFLSVIFPHDQVQILPYHRVLKDLPGLTPSDLLLRLDGIFLIEKSGVSQPRHPHELSLFLAGVWYTLRFRPHLVATNDPLDQLDVTLLQKLVLGPVFGVDDPRRSERIDFVGGIRGAGELERLVASGQYACAFSMFPTRIEDLMAIAKAGQLMPPKSTWFEPKLRDGMFSITADKFQIVRIESELVSPVPKIRLAGEHQVVEYGPAARRRLSDKHWFQASLIDHLCEEFDRRQRLV